MLHAAARLSFALFVLTFIGCGSESSGPAVPSGPVSPIAAVVDADSMNDVQREQQQIALAARDALFQRLSARLMEVLGESGPSRAIQVCKVDAPRLAAEVGEEFGVSIGRTSHRLRNPQNSPPTWAQQHVDRQVAEPQFFARDDDRLAALLPIRTMAACVLCHGPKDEIVPEVRAALVSHYPEDQATGFQEGDLRGWFWIDVPVPNG
jgi:hypothetical protein